MYRLLLTLISARLAAPLSSEFLINVLSSTDSQGEQWAVLVAGSNDWSNYRHQADVCHAYQILHNHGIPDERIVVMMYDDLAHNHQNPTPGIIINHPNGEDVYHGVPRDYTREDVTPDNFLNVLQGNEEKMRNIGSGKVIKSGPNDHVFLYFAGHGSQGLIAFPNSPTGDEVLSAQFLYATQLIDALKAMHRDKKLKKMVIYTEACESGSMFENILPDSINIFATTAANATESSYATYWDEQRQTFLGDVYSVNWMEDSDREIITSETLQEQYEIVKRNTEKSHVQQHGDLSIAPMPVAEFQGREEGRPIIYKPAPRDSVPSREVPLEILKRKLTTSDGEERYRIIREMKKQIRNRAFADQVVESIVWKVARTSSEANYILTVKQNIKNFNCYEDIVRHFHHECFRLNKNAYVLGKLNALVNMCENNWPVNEIKIAMEETCTYPPVYGII